MVECIGNHDIIGAGTLFSIRQLLGDDPGELVGAHRAALHHPCLLHFGWGGNHDDGIHGRVTAGFVKQRDIENQDVGAGGLAKRGPVGGDQRVNDGLDPFQRTGVIGNDPFQRHPVDTVLANRLRKGREPGEETIAISGSRQLGGRGLSVSAQNCVVTEWRDEQAISKADLVQAPALQGAHNGQNAAAAFAAARALGVPAEQIAASFLTFPGLAHRMEPLGQAGRVRFVNDSKATNADAAARALDTFDQIYWIAGGIAKDGGIDSLQPYFARIRKAYLIGQDAERFAKSLEGKVETVMSGTLEQAVKDAARDAAAGTDGDPVVLLSPACASFDQFADFEKRGEAFRAAVEEVEGFMPRVTAAS